MLFYRILLGSKVKSKKDLVSNQSFLKTSQVTRHSGVLPQEGNSRLLLSLCSCDLVILPQQESFFNEVCMLLNILGVALTHINAPWASYRCINTRAETKTSTGDSTFLLQPFQISSIWTRKLHILQVIKLLQNVTHAHSGQVSPLEKELTYILVLAEWCRRIFFLYVAFIG